MFSLRLFMSLGLLLLCGCSATSSDTYATLRYALLGVDDVEVTSEKVRQLPYASAYLRVGDNPQALVVLAFADPDGSLSWVSSDNKLFVTKSGRLHKTLGLENDLYLVASSWPDPLQKMVNTPDKSLNLDAMSWQYTAEWEKDYVSGYSIRAKFISAVPEKLLILDKSHDVVLIDELVSVGQGQNSWHNYYWFEHGTGRILKSQQQLGPDLPVIEMTILKPFAL
ncbi:TPA: YjbF family lipoprotein [Aeromonas hydrophila]|uniref:YjbF family lipoprotein n=1 Tax=Aeromonas hydrophila TaxID=644 RepID=UPI001CCB3A16|nr:YjbF family lipoprotein [Aeromonas hydrophila]UBQ51353.1 YjbF family lipoprotein [Aeromonas hydrophila]HDI1212418.1 YjbF family lipoprotein [Aeromonas hydrophila]